MQNFQRAQQLFVADLHLLDATSPRYRLALDLFNKARDFPDLQELWILGDLFEYWIGDDAGTEEHAELVNALSTLAQGGCKVSMMFGNRDFLLDERFAHACGARLIRDDIAETNLNGERILLLHGDTLCLDDHAYQRFRKEVRSTEWQRDFLSKPIAERKNIARTLRNHSAMDSRLKDESIMDVSDAAVTDSLREHAVNNMIHGHTHRPDVHTIVVMGKDGERQGQRFVVGDWQEDHAMCVIGNTEGLRLVRWSGSS